MNLGASSENIQSVTGGGSERMINLVWAWRVMLQKRANREKDPPWGCVTAQVACLCGHRSPYLPRNTSFRGEGDRQPTWNPVGSTFLGAKGSAERKSQTVSTFITYTQRSPDPGRQNTNYSLGLHNFRVRLGN